MFARLGSDSASARAAYTAAPSTSSWRLPFSRRCSLGSGICQTSRPGKLTPGPDLAGGSEANNGPVKGNTDRKPNEFYHRQDGPDFDQVGVAEITVGIADHQRRRLI